MAQNDTPNPLVFDPAAPLPPYAGPALTPWQYEALCRHALSREYTIPIHDIKTGYLQSPTKTRHQIDLYWTSHDGVCDFLCFANAKFRQANVSLHEIMTLLGVQRDIHAHEAMMITNTGYSPAALNQANEKGIALLIVRPAPTLDVASLPKRNAPTVAQAMKMLPPACHPSTTSMSSIAASTSVEAPAPSPVQGQPRLFAPLSLNQQSASSIQQFPPVLLSPTKWSPPHPPPRAPQAGSAFAGNDWFPSLHRGGRGVTRRAPAC
jgi:hypothetical protein